MIPLGKRKKKKRRRKKRSGNFTCYEDMKQLEITKVMETILNVLSRSSFCVKPSASDVDDTVSSVFSAQMKNKLCWTDCFLYITNWKLELSVLRNDELDRLWSIKMNYNWKIYWRYFFIFYTWFFTFMNKYWLSHYKNGFGLLSHLLYRSVRAKLS